MTTMIANLMKRIFANLIFVDQIVRALVFFRTSEIHTCLQS